MFWGMGKLSLWFLKKGNSEHKFGFGSDPPPYTRTECQTQFSCKNIPHRPKNQERICQIQWTSMNPSCCACVRCSGVDTDVKENTAMKHTINSKERVDKMAKKNTNNWVWQTRAPSVRSSFLIAVSSTLLMTLFVSMAGSCHWDPS